MPLIKDGCLVADTWASLADEAPLESWHGDVIVSLERWQRDKDLLASHTGRLGLRLRSDQSPTEVRAELTAFALVALEFPKFGDGRAYSAARLLRERFAFAGEIRAVGDVLRDQFLFMHRCGFDAFEIAMGTAEEWHDALSEITVWYQPATVEEIRQPQTRRVPEVAATGIY